jgi:DNA mismatch endonuclease (patch repair protein)
VDGAWWHGHPDYYTPGKSGEFWDTKIERNMERDRRADEDLAVLGWQVVRLWDFEVVKDPAGSAGRVAAALGKAHGAQAQQSERERRRLGTSTPG